MKQPTKKDLQEAVAILADHERGQKVLADILAMIRNGGDGLDIVNQEAVLTIFRCQFGPFGGSTRDEIGKALR